MNKKLIFFSLMILISISFVYAYTFGDVLSGKISLVDILSGLSAKKPITTNCVDSDGGINYYTYGNVTRCTGTKCYTYRDSCSGTSGKLSEKYCKGNNVATNNSYKCPNGCSNGACISLPTNQTITNTTCIDTDNGQNFYIRGNTTVRGVTSTDSCTNSTLLREYFCTSANEIDAINYGCSCSYGKCA